MCIIRSYIQFGGSTSKETKGSECGYIHLWSHHWGGLSLWVLGLPILYSETSSLLAKKYKKKCWLWTILEEKTEIYREVPCEYLSFSWNGTGAYLANSNCHYCVFHYIRLFICLLFFPLFFCSPYYRNAILHCGAVSYRASGGTFKGLHSWGIKNRISCII